MVASMMNPNPRRITTRLLQTHRARTRTLNDLYAAFDTIPSRLDALDGHR